MEWELVGEDLPQWHFVHHNPHMTCPEIDPRSPNMEVHKKLAKVDTAPLKHLKTSFK
jgi:hypothetical protein